MIKPIEDAGLLKKRTGTLGKVILFKPPVQAPRQRPHHRQR